MERIEIRRGDTLQLGVVLTDQNGETFTPAPGQKLMLSVGIAGSPMFTVPVVDGVAGIRHEDTKSISPGEYRFDVRLYDADKTLVATPIYGEFAVLEVVNDDI